MTSIPSVRHKAIDYLAMREHSYLELSRKLQKKGYDQLEIDQALGELIDDNLLSDTRFAEAFVRSRVLKGQGPMRIRMELKERGVDDYLIDLAFEENEVDWDELIEATWLKKYSSYDEYQRVDPKRQWRFLQYRGFTHSQISKLFRHIENLESCK